MLERMKEAVEKELQDLVLWAPAFIAIGILLYFKWRMSLPIDHPMLMVIGPGLCCLALHFRLFKTSYYRLAQVLLLVTLGFLSITLRIYTVASPIIPGHLDGVRLEGTISQIQNHKNGTRIWLDEPYIEDLAPTETPKIVRIVVRSKEPLKVGYEISCMATLMPPQPAILPDKFDFAEYAYFKQIGAIGAATSRITVIGQTEYMGYRAWIHSIRHSIALRILAVIPQPAAGVAIGLLIGDASFILESTAADLRTSGIAHLVAISGMHMVIIVSMIFLSLRWLLSWSVYISLYYDTKKLAAICAVLGSFLYLLLAGSPISAQRAFIVSTFVLLAIILDRKGIPLRLLMISGICLLLVTPEAIKNPSLQMSFAACIALLAISQYSSKILDKIKIRPYRLWRYMSALVIASTIAGIATTPFLIYHFSTFSTYGVLTNMLAVPLNDFAIMMLGIIGLLLMPMDLEYWPLTLMGYLIKFMLWLAHEISSMQGSIFYINSLSSTGLFWISLGGLLLALGSKYVRYGGCLLIIVAAIYGYQPIRPDVIIAAGGKLFAVRDGENYYFSNKRSARYIRQSLAQYLGIKDPLYLSDWKNETCSKDFCIIKKSPYDIILLANKSEWDKACSNAALFVNLYNDEVCPHALRNIGKTALERNGTHLFTFNQNGVGMEAVGATPAYVKPENNRSAMIGL